MWARKRGRGKQAVARNVCRLTLLHMEGPLMYVHVRRALTVAALIAFAGCSGAATTPSGSPGASAVTSAVHRGVPFIPFMRHNVVPNHSVQPAYATNGSLVFEGDQ